MSTPTQTKPKQKTVPGNCRRCKHSALVEIPQLVGKVVCTVCYCEQKPPKS